MNWTNRVSDGATLQECFENARLEIEETCGLRIGIMPYNHLPDLMAFVATRYAAAKGEKFEGLAWEQYDMIKDKLGDTIFALLHLQKGEGPRKLDDPENEALNQRFGDVSKTVVGVLEERIPEWASGKEIELG